MQTFNNNFYKIYNKISLIAQKMKNLCINFKNIDYNLQNSNYANIIKNLYIS